ncbi:MAG: DUF2817 domain-containing protein [Ruminococcaceae bacterium]|nr:DUF2817 domain-containing protein [Oscillospiraceae bacterium]
MKNNDALFREISLDLSACMAENLGIKVNDDGIRAAYCQDHRAIVLPLDFGAAYVVRPVSPEKVSAALVESDPRTLTEGETLEAVDAAAESNEACEFLVVPRKDGLYLLLDASPDALTVGRSTILLGSDTDDDWYDPGPQPSFDGTPGSFADWQWSSGEVFANLYDPLMQAYPDYITRESIGFDESGKYEMFAYTFAPADYEQTIIITGGIHGEEIDGYLSLARFLTLLAQEDGSHTGLHYLRTKVRLVVIPLVNVWAATETHTRRNSAEIDLNRDFGDHSQAETKNVVRYISPLAGKASALIDFHCANSDKYDLYYQFSIQAPNAPVCLKVTNHVYEDLKRLGYGRVPTNLELIPGKYEKKDKYLQGYAWNHLNIPTLVAEHFQVRFGLHSAFSAEMGVKYYGNFLIQTALSRLNLH